MSESFEQAEPFKRGMRYLTIMENISKFHAKAQGMKGELRIDWETRNHSQYITP